MSEENNNTEMFAEKSSNVADSTKKVSEDAQAWAQNRPVGS